MRFSLHYRGPLESNGKPEHKHALRMHFHEQLTRVWTEGPMQRSAEHLLRPRQSAGMFCVLREFAGHVWAPLVTEEMFTTAELTISVLWPRGSGTVLRPGGDIDNRLKTLFDALSMPQQPNQIPDGALSDAPSLIYTLLEDDKLVSSVSVRTATLWEPVTRPIDVELLVEVFVRAEQATSGNSMFGR